MKIYFAGSIRGGRNDQELYQKIIEILSSFGTVLTEHVGNKDLLGSEEEARGDVYIYQRDTAWLKEADVLVAEVTTPSLGVGIEITRAEVQNKPILCLYREIPGRQVSAMISGNENIPLKAYQDVAELEEIVREFFTTVVAA